MLAAIGEAHLFLRCFSGEEGPTKCLVELFPNRVRGSKQCRCTLQWTWSSNSQISFKKEQSEVACQWGISSCQPHVMRAGLPMGVAFQRGPAFMTDVGRGDPFLLGLLAWTSIQISCIMPATLCFRLWFPAVDFSWSSTDFLHYCAFLWLAMWWCNKWYFFIY